MCSQFVLPCPRKLSSAEHVQQVPQNLKIKTLNPFQPPINLLNTMNSWTAKALEQAGLEIQVQRKGLQ